MQYAHRCHLPAEAVLRQASGFFGGRLALAAEGPRERAFSGSLGRITVRVAADGGHATVVTVATDQVGESEADKLAKRFLTLLHAGEHPGFTPIGAY